MGESSPTTQETQTQPEPVAEATGRRARIEERLAGRPAWQRHLLLLLAFAIVAAPVVAQQAVANSELSIFDEWQYSERVHQVSEGDLFMRNGEVIGDWAQGTRACRGIIRVVGPQPDPVLGQGTGLRAQLGGGRPAAVLLGDRCGRRRSCGAPGSWTTACSPAGWWAPCGPPSACGPSSCSPGRWAPGERPRWWRPRRCCWCRPSSSSTPSSPRTPSTSPWVRSRRSRPCASCGASGRGGRWSSPDSGWPGSRDPTSWSWSASGSPCWR